MGDNVNGDFSPTLLGISKEALITVAGIVTSLATALLNFGISRATGYDVFSWMFWFVVPIGALFGGFAAASGYYAAARLTQTMPSHRLAWQMIVIAAVTWLFAYWLDYVTLALPDGTRAADVVGFWDYWKIQAEHSTLTLVGRFNGYQPQDLGEAGWWGYVRELLQFVGFVTGGFALYRFLTDVETCSDCRLYAKDSCLLQAVEASVFDSALQNAEVSLPDLGAQARTVLGNRNLVGVSLHSYSCPKCPSLWLRPSLVVQSGSRSTTSIKLGAYRGDANMMHRLQFACREAVKSAKEEKKARRSYRIPPALRFWKQSRS